MTAHIVIKDADLGAFEKIKSRVKQELSHLHIDHVTLEIELEDNVMPCQE
jgi:Co/Zn/Cd efflux system component